MTNIQAIDLLKGLEQSLDDYCELNDEGKTAFRMAITALELFGNSERLPSAQPELCEDAVSRQRLLSDLKELVAVWKKYPVMVEQIKGVEAAIGYVESIPFAQPEQRWIPCSERLPEEEKKTYWVCTDIGWQCECRWTNNRFGIGEGEWGWSIFDTPQYSKPIAWMPLPEPYTERWEE